MKYVSRYRDGRKVATEIHPETEEDVALLRERYPHCFPCEYVVVAEKLELTPVELSGRWHRSKP